MRIVLVTCTALALGCSALIEVDAHQCAKHAQCVEADLGDRCESGVCVEAARGCKGETCESSVRTPDSVCASDRHCSEDAAPRCLRGVCVSEELAALWICEPEPEPEPTESGPVEYSFDVIEFRSGKPPGNLVASACRSNDADCSDPLATFEDEAGTGHVQFELPSGFLGFIQVESDALPALSYLSKPIRRDTVGRVLPVSAPSTVELLATIDGTTVDPDKGIALLEAFDCTDTPAGGVHFEESRGTAHPFYIVNHTPNSDITTSVLDAENNVADGGFLNLDPGFITFTARLGVDGPVLGEFNARVRAGAITFVDMYF
jgi:hypothetical protein